ncbi:MAG: NAD(P)H-dependent oxidoreductase subunit E [Nitrospiraceae bacterium]|nr:NAD(P)H-dependent oxidoreductase subunit E [Nitrospiraceae bacterium]
MNETTERVLNKLLDQHRREQGNLISLLQRIQDTFGHIAEEYVDWFAEKLDVPASKFFGVITFYPKFRTRPMGKNTITVCCGAACHIKGADKLLDAAKEALGLTGDEDTTKDLAFTLQKATCIGACSVAPVVILNKQVHSAMDPVKVTKLVKGYEREEFLGYL